MAKKNSVNFVGMGLGSASRNINPAYQFNLTVLLIGSYIHRMKEEALSQEVMSLATVVGVLMRRVRTAAAHNLSWSHTTVLGRLAKDGPATSAELARAEGVRPQSMGTIVAELFELGLVARRPHPTDGRQMLIELTEQGIAFRAAAKGKKLGWLVHTVAALEEKDQKTLFAATRILERLVEL